MDVEVQGKNLAKRYEMIIWLLTCCLQVEVHLWGFLESFIGRNLFGSLVLGRRK